MLGGHDMIAKAPTGTGKTVAFGIPILSKVNPGSLKPQAVILSPTRELAQQIAQDLQNLAQFLPAIKSSASTAARAWTSSSVNSNRAARSLLPRRAA